MNWQRHLYIYMTLFILPRAVEYFVTFGKFPLISVLDSRSFLGNFCYFYAGCWFCSVLLKRNIPFGHYKTKRFIKIMVNSFSIAACWVPISSCLYYIFGVHCVVLAALGIIEISRRVWQEQVNLIHFSLKTLYLLGVVSYGYYVYHGFMYKLVELDFLAKFGISSNFGSFSGFLAIVFVPFFIAIPSYYFVEKRIIALYKKS